MGEKELFVYIDGQFYPKSQAKISVFDHGLLYGDGVFEGIRSYDCIVFKLKEHIDRLYSSAHTIMLDIPKTRQEIIDMVIETLKRNCLRDAYIRLVVTRGEGDLGLDPRKCKSPTIIIIAGKIKLIDDATREKGATAWIPWVRRNQQDATPPEVKSLNYLNNVVAKIEANIAGADEAIFLNYAGLVSEGVGENIFIVKKGKLSTPPSAANALPGITREEVEKLAAKLGYTVEEKDSTPHDLFNADEVFFTGTAAEIIPVREINKRLIGTGWAGPITKALIEEFKKIIRDPWNGVEYSI